MYTFKVILAVITFMLIGYFFNKRLLESHTFSKKGALIITGAFLLLCIGIIVYYFSV